MSVDLSEYISCLGLEEGHEHQAAIDAAYHEAGRVMSPRGLQNYLEGIRALCTLGRGTDLVLT